MEQPLPAAIRQRLSPKPNPTSAATGSCLVPAMALYWFFFHNPVPLTKPAGKKKKKNKTQCFSWVRLSSPKARSAPAQAHRRAAVHKVGSREDRARNHLFWQQHTENGSAITWGCISMPYSVEIYPSHSSLCELSSLSLQIEDGWTETKGFFFSLRSSKNIFPPLLQVT